MAYTGHIFCQDGGIVAVGAGAVAAVEDLRFLAMGTHNLAGMENDGIGNGQGSYGGHGAGLGAVVADFYCGITHRYMVIDAQVAEIRQMQTKFTNCSMMMML